jgi:hypothetical protein
MTQSIILTWSSDSPVPVDEQLVVNPDGSITLITLAPYDRFVVHASSLVGELISATVGVYQLTISQVPDTLQKQFSKVPPGRYEFHLESDLDVVQSTAFELALVAKAHPAATVTFSTFCTGVEPDGSAGLVLVAVGGGSRPLRFQVSPTDCTVHFYDDSGQALSWAEIGEFPSGFVTPDADGLGGVGRLATIEPGRYGAIAFSEDAPPGTVAVGIRVCGFIVESLPDRPDPVQFQVQTRAVSISATDH